MQGRNHSVSLDRRQALLSVQSTPGLPPARAQACAGTAPIEVWQRPSCGCCQDWATHREANGIRTLVRATGNSAMRGRLGISRQHHHFPTPPVKEAS